MQSRVTTLTILFSVFALGLFGIQDAYAQVPSIPQNLFVEEQSDTQIDVTWDEPATGAPILSYNIYVESPQTFPLAGSPFNVPYTGPSELFQHTGLDPETGYFYQVSAINSSGEGPLSPVKATETLPSGTIFTIVDQTTCEDELDATLVWTTSPDTCTLEAGEALELGAGDELIISSGVIFVVDTDVDDGDATIDAPGKLTNHGTLNNLGDITSTNSVNDGTINNSGTFTSDETFDNTSGTLTNDGDFTSNEDFTNTSGTITNNVTLTNEGDFVNSSGSFTNTGTLTNNNDFNAGSGTITNSASGIIDNDSDFTFLGPVINSGTINNSDTITITSTGSIDNTSGTINNSATITNQCGPITGNLVVGTQPVDECFPVVTIDLPTITTFTNQDLIDFAASASDLDNYGIDVGPTFVNNVIWTHEITPPATQFGMGATVDDLPLAAGTYLITASVTDAASNTTIDQITLQVDIVDVDGDTYAQAGEGILPQDVDCDDSLATGFPINPGATELPADGVDQNCDTQELCHADSDMDAYGDFLITVVSTDLNCDEPTLGEADDALDCDDADFDVNPDGTELPADGVDQNCDTQELCYVDSDMDTYGNDDMSTVLSLDLICDEPLLSEADDALDCDDADFDVNPGVAEIFGNGIDDNCDGQIDEGFTDADGDGYDDSVDCNDNDASINPGATEIPGDEVDQNCDLQELCYVDSDMDTYGNDDMSTVLSLDLICDEPLLSEADDALDCDDANFAVNPAAVEIFNQIDDNCDGQIDEGFQDNDMDGFPFPEDCNDDDNTIYPGAPELLDQKDNDCDGIIDEGFDQDGDGYFTGQEGLPDTDCDDTDPEVNPGHPEIFGNEIDDNCNDEIDEEKIISPVFQADLTEKQIKKFEKLVDRWEHQIDKLNAQIIKLNERADEAEAKGQIEKAERLRAQADSKSEEVEILEDNIAIVQISIGEIPEDDVLVHFQDKLTEKKVKKIIKQIEKLEKKIDRLNTQADRFDEKAQHYEEKGKQEKADRLYAKAASLRAEAAVWEDIQQVLICAVDYKEPPPKRITISGTIRDFHDSHINMEQGCAEGQCSGVELGIVKDDLNVDGTPDFNMATITTSTAADFFQWYHDDPNVNDSMAFSLDLKKSSNDPLIYTFDSGKGFFPIDKKLFGKEGFKHNYHFTIEFHEQFTYEPGQMFKFTGDDDVWVFIDKKLALDLGGVHPATSETIDLDALGLTPGQTYDIDVFFAERQTVQSNFRIDTSIIMN